MILYYPPKINVSTSRWENVTEGKGGWQWETVTETGYFLLHQGARRQGPYTLCKGKEALKESLQVGVLAF